MWIIPKTLSAYVPDTAESSLELSELALMCEQSLMWRSKPSQSRTWLQRLNKVKWMQLLSGRILKPSMDGLFVEKYTESLGVIPASHSAGQETGREKTTPDTFGRIYSNILKQLDLFGFSVKMSQGTLKWDLTKFTEAWQIWDSKLKLDYLVRQSAVYPMKGKGYSFWPTLTKYTCQRKTDWNRVKAGKHKSNIKEYVALKENLPIGEPWSLGIEWCEWHMGLNSGWTDITSWEME
jgi:hypothetical protein